MAATVEQELAAKAAFVFLREFAPPTQVQAWNVTVGKRPASFAPCSPDAYQWLLANIRSPAGCFVSIKGMQYTKHLAVETHLKNLKPFPAKAMSAVQAGDHVSLLWRLVNETDLAKAEDLARKAIRCVGGGDLKFLFPLPGSIRNQTTVIRKHLDPRIVTRPTQFAMADTKKSGSSASRDSRGDELVRVLQSFGVASEFAAVSPGPVVTLWEVTPGPGVKASRIVELADDIARAMNVDAARVVKVTGRNTIGIELPSAKREMVKLSDIFVTPEWRNTEAILPLVLGRSINGTPVVVDLQKMPHLMIAGATGAGKSVTMNTLILSLLNRLSPAECSFVMIDPKTLELSPYNGIPHLVAPVVTEPERAIEALNWVIREMEARYVAMMQREVYNVAEYNELVPRNERITYLVVVIDEMADLMDTAGKDVEVAVRRLAAKARAAGIHLIMATQRPSVDVITGVIKANFPSRLALQVSSVHDSRTIIGEAGAEQLLGQGDMLYMAGGGKITRVHGAFVPPAEIRETIRRLRAGGGQPGRLGGEAMVMPRQPQRALALEAPAVQGRTETARESVERILKNGPRLTNELLAEAKISRARLYQFQEEGFVVSEDAESGRTKRWALGG